MRLFIPIILLLLFACAEQNTIVEKQSLANLDWISITSPTKSHLRGLDAALDGTVWASGTEGMVLRSIDSGSSWSAFPIPDCAKIDFRDIEAFDQNVAVVMSSGNGVRFYFTSDTGTTWQLTYEDTNRKVFFDGMDFNGARGMAYGDPIDGKFTMLESIDSGKTWEPYDRTSMDSSIAGEAGFAASGTGIVLGNSSIWIAASGRKEARVYRTSASSSWETFSTPLSSSASAGIFSMAFFHDMHGIVVGGDYKDSTNAENNAAFTMDGGLTWKSPSNNPSGYRSCVVFLDDGTAVATGRSGTDISYDEGQSWEPISPKGYFSCIGLGNVLIGVGRSGKIGRIQFRQCAYLCPL